jgi:voltage-gated potassium channel
VLPISDDIRSVARLMNGLLSLFLIADAIARFVRSAARLHWLLTQWGWLMLIGSLPVPFATAGRLVATGMMIRQLRRADFEAVGVSIVAKRAQSTLLGVLLLAILVFELAGILVLQTEHASPGANILTANDALWWSYVTIATVGYGDRYPVTNYGRLVGIAVMTVGVALFSVITSYLADWFRRPHTTPVRHLPAGVETSKEATALIAAMRQTLDEKAQADQSVLDELRARLDQIERQLQ